MAKPHFYTVGGTVQAGGGLYIARHADQELLELCRGGAFAYVLTSRQVGKSSLMVRTDQRLDQEGIRSVIVDLTQLGVQVTEEAWYLGMLTTIAEDLGVKTEVIEWWRTRAHLGRTQRLTQFFQEVLLAEIPQRLVIFVDEIDTTLGLQFTDDFYAAIRYIYNARAIAPEYQRLSFVLIGVATPSDLISDPRRTPFNIGARVDLADFTFNEALPLIEGLELPSAHAREVLGWCMKWTGGHPYLTQRLCRAVAEQYRSLWTEAEIAATVAGTFFGKMSEQDHNLQFVRDMLTRRAPDPVRVLAAYREVRLSKRPVKDEEQSLVKSYLKLAGVVQRREGALRVRNAIYEEVFDRGWIKKNERRSWFATVPLSVKAAAALLVAAVIFLAMFARATSRLAESERQRVLVEEQRIAASQQAAEQYRLKAEEANAAGANAERERQRADHERQRAESEANKARQLARAAGAARDEALRQQTQAEYNASRADSVRKIAEHERTKVELFNRRALARLLAAEVQQQRQQKGQSELSALLARQAFLFNQKSEEQLDNEVYEALRTALNASNQIPIVASFNLTGQSALSANGLLFAGVEGQGVLRVWDLSRPSQPRLELNLPKINLRCLTFSPKGEALAAADQDGNVRTWALLETGVVARERNYGAAARTLAFHPNSELLAVGLEDGRLIIAPLKEDETASTTSSNAFSTLSSSRPVAGHKPMMAQMTSVTAIAFSPIGRAMAYGLADGSVRLLQDFLKPKASVTLRGGHSGQVKTLAFSPKGDLLISGGTEGALLQWQWRKTNARPTPLPTQKEEINGMAFSPSGDTLATISANLNLSLWDLSRGANITMTPHERSFNLAAVAFNAGGTKIITASKTGTIYSWDLLAANENPIQLRDHKGAVRTLAFSPDGKRLASGSEDENIILWDLARPYARAQTLRGHKSSVRALAFSPDGYFLVSAGEDKTVRAWAVQEAKPTAVELGRHQDAVWAVAFSANGRWLASTGADSKIQVRERSANGFVLKYEIQDSTKNRALAFHPQQPLLAAAGEDGKIRVWHLDRVAALQLVLPGQEPKIWALAFSPDGKKLASGGVGRRVRLWDFETAPGRFHDLPTLESWITTLSFSADGQTLASGMSDGTIRLWNLARESSSPVILKESDKHLWAVAFNPAAPHLLASGGENKTVMLWTTSSAQLAESVCARVRRNLTLEEWQHYIGASIPYEPTCPKLPAEEKPVLKVSSNNVPRP